MKIIFYISYIYIYVCHILDVNSHTKYKFYISDIVNGFERLFSLQMYM